MIKKYLGQEMTSIFNVNYAHTISLIFEISKNVKYGYNKKINSVPC